MHDLMSMKFLFHVKNVMVSPPYNFHHNWTTQTVAMNSLHKNIYLSLQQNICTKLCHIICSICRFVYMEFNKIGFFPFMIFSYFTVIFQKFSQNKK